ncbi:unnamed protein product [Rangifer tarandus platyrhynchus]|uniref:Uncharacterized protein n=1 Tax=Rangifer tarandus platyrhynchus TaxID=3082113 RepID=A0AC59ZB19_RANTA
MRDNYLEQTRTFLEKRQGCHGTKYGSVSVRRKQKQDRFSMNEWDGDWESWTHRWRRRWAPQSKEQKGARPQNSSAPPLLPGKFPRNSFNSHSKCHWEPKNIK